MVQLRRRAVQDVKRSNNFVTLADVVGWWARTWSASPCDRKPEAQMDFDFAKVVEASKDNPVFYVQYAHARIRSTLRKGEAEGLLPSGKDIGLLGAEEIELVKLAAQFPRLVEAAAQAREPHRVAFFLHDLAAAFHAYWNLGNDKPEKRFIVAQDALPLETFLAHRSGSLCAMAGASWRRSVEEI
jgi:arginyl-tRNA synthetase